MQWSLTKPDVTGLVGIPDTESFEQSVRRSVVLTRLEEKGYLTHSVDGRTNVYCGVDAPQSVAAGAVRQIIERLCGGSVEQLLIGMVDDEVLSERELQRLAQKIAKRK